jgi:hypothetical protein
MSQEMTRREWVIRHQRLTREFRVTGFLDSGLAIRHVRKHFLNRLERWAQLGPSVAPDELKQKLVEAGCNCGAGALSARNCPSCRPVLLAGVDAYVGLVEKECRHLRDAAETRRAYSEPNERGEGGYFGPSLVVVTDGGVFAAFAIGKPSHLTTALRPVPRVVSGPLTRTHYLTAALAKLLGARTAGRVERAKKMR